MDQKSVSKLTTTQNVIRKKFRKARAFRLESEQDVNDAMKHLTNGSSKTNNLETKNNSTQSLNHLNDLDSKNSSAHSNSHSNHAIGMSKNNERDPNKLCDILRTLLTSFSQNADRVNHLHQIDIIFNELRDLEIIT